MYPMLQAYKPGSFSPSPQEVAAFLELGGVCAARSEDYPGQITSVSRYKAGFQIGEEYRSF